VNLIGFSADDCFVCGAGQDGLLYIWDIETGETLTGQKMPSEVSVLRWVDQRKVNHYTSYDLVIGHSNILLYATLSYAAERGQWVLSMQPFTMPPGGNLIRSYLSLDVSNDGVFVYVGTTGGEMMVFRRDTGVFRACIPVCTGGTQSVVSLPNNDVVCSGGDGSICRLQGSDMSWRIVKEVSI
jgi:WD40 repeat protein